LTASASRRAEAARKLALVHADALRQSLRITYEARFGVLPPELLAALNSASADQLTAWLPRFVTAPSAAEILALTSL
jgi:hypothetical protein